MTRWIPTGKQEIAGQARNDALVLFHQIAQNLRTLLLLFVTPSIFQDFQSPPHNISYQLAINRLIQRKLYCAFGRFVAGQPLREHFNRFTTGINADMVLIQHKVN
jgi:hypothetical protein